MQSRAIVVGPEESPFPTLYASRERDWSWRLENRHLTLQEHDSVTRLQPNNSTLLTAIAPSEPSEVRDDEDYVAIMLGDGEIYYADEGSAADLVGLDVAVPLG